MLIGATTSTSPGCGAVGASASSAGRSRNQYAAPAASSARTTSTAPLRLRRLPAGASARGASGGAAGGTGRAPIFGFVATTRCSVSWVISSSCRPAASAEAARGGQAGEQLTDLLRHAAQHHDVDAPVRLDRVHVGVVQRAGVAEARGDDPG